MTVETQHLEFKSLRLIEGKTTDFSGVAKICVCFANAAGGTLRIGVEDGHAAPSAAQAVDASLLDLLRKRIGALTDNVQATPQLLTHSNGGQYIDVVIARSQGIASTSDGRFYLRVGDSC